MKTAPDRVGGQRLVTDFDEACSPLIRQQLVELLPPLRAAAVSAGQLLVSGGELVRSERVRDFRQGVAEPARGKPAQPAIARLGVLDNIAPAHGAGARPAALVLPPIAAMADGNIFAEG